MGHLVQYHVAEKSVPTALAATRTRYGVALLALALAALPPIAALLLVQTPPRLRHGLAILFLLLGAIILSMVPLGLLWTALALWPRERRRLSLAQRASQPDRLATATSGSLGRLALPIMIGIAAAAGLWTLLNAVGLIGAPMLWVIGGVTNLETARRVRRVERRERVVYYEGPVSPLVGVEGRLFAVPLSGSRPRRTRRQRKRK